MISAFVASWALFHNTYLAGMLLAVLLALVGCVVVARDQIFIGAAVSQASMLGIAAAMWATAALHESGCGVCEGDAFLTFSGIVCAVAGALVSGGGQSAAGRESREAVTGWVFLVGASVSVLLLSRSPHGLEEVHRLMASTVIGATRGEVALLGALVAVSLAVLAARFSAILLTVMDPEMAAAVGVPVRGWTAAMSVWLGLTVGFSIRVGGVIYAFGCLVLPALVAKNLCREVRTMFVLAPLLALATSTAAFVLANAYDLPPGQLAAALLAAQLVAAWALAPLRARGPTH